MRHMAPIQKDALHSADCAHAPTLADRRASRTARARRTAGDDLNGTVVFVQVKPGQVVAECWRSMTITSRLPA